MKESDSREIELPNIEESVFLLLREYLYTDTCAPDANAAIDLISIAHEVPIQ